jgi:hypothetical protein
MENAESKFIEFYFKSSESFKKQTSYFITLLDAEDAGHLITIKYE